MLLLWLGLFQYMVTATKDEVSEYVVKQIQTRNQVKICCSFGCPTRPVRHKYIYIYIYINQDVASQNEGKHGLEIPFPNLVRL